MTLRIRRRYCLAVISLAMISPAGAQDVADYFRQNCIACHTVGGGRLAGPDLKDVTERKDRAWLVQFLLNPQAMVDKGDPYALKLQKEAHGMVMPAVAGMTQGRAEEIVTLLGAESKAPHAPVAGLQVSDAPFTADDVTQGRYLFQGQRHLANGGPPCIFCHNLRGLGGLGGGRLGPDLTRVYDRLQGRKNLGAWLSAPATPTMSSVFKNHALRPEEIMPLIGLFEDGPGEAVGRIPPQRSIS